MLQQMTARLKAERDFEGTVRTVLKDVVALHGAEFGDVQLVVDGALLLVDQLGFAGEALSRFRVVRRSDGTACARAFRSRRAVVIGDLREDGEFAPYREIADQLGFRAVQSTPLITSQNACIGVVSTHFAQPHEPTAIEMQTLGAYAGLAADLLVKRLGAGELKPRAKAMSDALLSAPAR